MPELLVDIFAEDYAHEAFLRPLLVRLGDEIGCSLDIRIISAKGGHPRVLEELGIYRRAVEKEILPRLPDLIVIATDTNCSTYSRKVKALQGAAGATLEPKSVLACPDPHIERWYIADPPSFQAVVGAQPRPGRKKCDRDRYKAILTKAISDGGHPPLLGGAEFAADLVGAMDLFRAGKTEKSLKHFVDAAKSQLRRVANQRETT